MTGRGTLAVVNVVGATAAAGFAVRGVVTPAFVRPAETTGPLDRFWAASSAVRTLSVVVPAVAAVATRHRAAPTLLTVAGAIQLGDSALGVWQGKTDMTLAPLAMGVIHLLSARVLARDS